MIDSVKAAAVERESDLRNRAVVGRGGFGGLTGFARGSIAAGYEA